MQYWMIEIWRLWPDAKQAAVISHAVARDFDDAFLPTRLPIAGKCLHI